MSHHEVGDRLPLFRSPVIRASDSHTYDLVAPGKKKQHKKAAASNDSEDQAHPQDNNQALHDHPEFHRHAEATNAELFYDLFFVANLTVFTAVHEVNDSMTLQQYIGFFCILWFTWYQVGLYDVRFSMDSVFERIAKACQFGVMVGFAVVGPNFDVGSKAEENDGEGPSLSSFKALTLILMASRFVLVLQYIQSAWFTKQYKRTQLPMLLIAATYSVAGFIYLGLFSTFGENDSGENHTYLTWYIIAVIETVIATAVSSVWRVISFKGTHLVQRMSLLTLIILGEGVMALAKQCQAIVKSKVFTFSSSTIGQIVSAVLILYFLYMLYFDWMQDEHFGTIRQQIWAFLHFPLHLALVLAVEGIAQSISWNAANVESSALLKEQMSWSFVDSDNNITPYWMHATVPEWQQAAGAINKTATKIFYYAMANSKSLDETLKAAENLQTAANGTTVMADETTKIGVSINAANWIYNTLQLTVYELAGLVAPEVGGADASTDAIVDFDSDDSWTALQKENTKIFEVYVLTFIYFFVAIGLVVIICALLAALSKKEKRMVHWARLAASGFIGLLLCLLASIAVTSREKNPSMAFSNYTSSPWVLPTIVLALLLVVSLNGMRFPRDGKPLPKRFAK